MIMTKEIETIKKHIHQLYNSLMKKENKNSALLDICDVLLRCYQIVDQEKYPERLINRLVNYIYVLGHDNHIGFYDDDAVSLRYLANVGKRAGINGVYRANITDKSQFYGLFDDIPKH